MSKILSSVLILHYKILVCSTFYTKHVTFVSIPVVNYDVQFNAHLDQKTNLHVNYGKITNGLSQ